MCFLCCVNGQALFPTVYIIVGAFLLCGVPFWVYTPWHYATVRGKYAPAHILPKTHITARPLFLPPPNLHTARLRFSQKLEAIKQNAFCSFCSSKIAKLS